MIHGEAKMLRRRAALACPKVEDLLALLEQASESSHALQTRLADLVGCTPKTIGTWKRKKAAPHIYAPRLIEVEAKLRARLAPKEPACEERPLPLMANVVSVRVEGEQALVSFSLKVPGEEGVRSVCEVLVPRTALPSLGVRNEPAP